MADGTLVGSDAFTAAYRDTLRRHVDDPGERGLQQAYELGRRALRDGSSMLQLVDVHLAAHREIIGTAASERRVAADAFLLEALAAFEITQRGYVEAQREVDAEQQRAELLRGLTNAYLAVAAGESLAERSAQVCEQIKLLLGADDGRLVFGHELDDGPAVTGPAISAPLPGGGGTITAVAAAGRTWTDADRAVLAQLAVLIHGPIADARLLELSERLERISALLGAAADPDAVVDRLLAEGLEQTGAASGVVLLGDGDVLRIVGAARLGPWIDGDEVALDGPLPVAEVARTGRALFLASREEINRYVLEREIRSPDPAWQAWAVVPVQTAWGRAGVFAMRFSRPQPFDRAQRVFLGQIGERLATALERGRVFARERAARHEAEIATARVDRLRDLAVQLSQATTRRRVAATLLRHAIAISEASGGLIATRARRPREGEIVAALAGPQQGGRWSLVGVPGDLVRAIVSGESRELGRWDGRLPLAATVTEYLRQRQIGALGIYPLTAGSRQIGGIALGWSEPSVPEFDRGMLRAAVAMAGPALRRAGRYDVEHEIAATLQRSLLTVPDADVPGVAWATRYRAGSSGLAGGDWYDIIPLDDDRVGVAVGDIVGRGVDAAATMGQLRSATRALARLVADPGELLLAMDEYTRTTGQGLYSTMAYLVVDPRAALVRYAVAGHPPPLLRQPDGTVTTIESGRGPLLGLDDPRSTAELSLTAGSTIVLYTDGLVERRDEPIDVGIARLAAVLQTSERTVDPAGLCRRLMESALDDDAEQETDDVAIVVVTFTATACE